MTEVKAEAEKPRGLGRLCPETALIKIRTRDVEEACQLLHLWEEIQADVPGPWPRVFYAEANTSAMSSLR